MPYMKILIDPYSGETFRPKRRNQVFASAQNRKNYHNEKAADLRSIKSAVDRQLTRNFLIISNLVEKGKQEIISKEELLLKGYNHNYFTHLDDFKGKVCRCIYNFILPPSENQNYITIIHPDND